MRYVANFRAGLLPISGYCSIQIFQVLHTEEIKYRLLQGDGALLFMIALLNRFYGQQSFSLKLIENRQHFHRRRTLFQALVLSPGYGLTSEQKTQNQRAK